MIDAWLSSSLMTASSAVSSASNRPAWFASVRMTCVCELEQRVLGGGLQDRVHRHVSTLCRRARTLASKQEGNRMVSCVPWNALMRASSCLCRSYACGGCGVHST